MYQYLLIYRAPGLHKEMAIQLTKHIHGCLTSAILNYCLFVSFQSETPMDVLKGDLKSPECDFVLIEIEDESQIHLDFRNEMVANTIFHPFDSESECRREHESLRHGDFSIDEILEKLHDGGWDALTDDEKSYLRKSS